MSHLSFMRRAIELSAGALTHSEGGPFGAVVVIGGEIVGEGCNQVLGSRDPTAHAEVVAIRQACLHAGSHHLPHATLYTSCEPCPMCLGAILWSRISQVYFANRRQDAAAIGFDDDFFYEQIALAPSDRSIPMQPLLREEGLKVFEQWKGKIY